MTSWSPSLPFEMAWSQVRAGVEGSTLWSTSSETHDIATRPTASHGGEGGESGGGVTGGGLTGGGGENGGVGIDGGAPGEGGGEDGGGGPDGGDSGEGDDGHAAGQSRQ